MLKNHISALVITAIIFSSCSVKKQQEPLQHQVLSNDLPTMSLKLLEGEQIEVRELPGNTILILFFSDCDHCQREAKAIHERIDAFKNYTVYFISSDSLKDIQKFADDYQLNAIPNVKFGNTEVAMVIRSFGAVPTPSVYIYSSQKKLVKQFNGETDIEEIIKFL